MSKSPPVELEMYVIYHNPSDYPGKYVVRIWRGLQADREPLTVTTTLSGSRAALPPGLYNLERFEQDDPAIVEVWV